MKQPPPTYMVWNRTANLEKMLYADDVPASIFRTFSKHFYPPKLHLWVRDFLLDEISRNHVRWRKYQGSLLPLDVGFCEPYFKILSSYFYLDEQVLLMALGKWLTEQIAAAISHQSSEKLRWLDVCVRCLKIEKPDGEWINPTQQGKQKWINWLCKYFPGFRFPETPPFWYYLPRGEPQGQIAIKWSDLLSVGQQVLAEPLPLKLSPGEQVIIPLTIHAPGFYPFIDERHANITGAIFPSDHAELVYIQHAGKHETWIYQGLGGDPDFTKDGWSMVPRSGWMPLESGNLILMGRIAETEHGVRIVPGSMLLRIQYSAEAV